MILTWSKYGRFRVDLQWMQNADVLLVPSSTTRAGACYMHLPADISAVHISNSPQSVDSSNQTLVPVRVWNCHKDVNVPTLAFYAKVSVVDKIPNASICEMTCFSCFGGRVV